MTRPELPPNFPFSADHVLQYLNKIAFSAETTELPAPSLETLSQILNRHIKTIPFGGLGLVYYTHLDTPPSPVVNTLDPTSTRGVSVDPLAIFDKLVKQNREGYCFEHATLVRMILEFLGFTVFLTCSRIFGPEGDDYDDITHSVLIVTIEHRQYLVDAGFSHFSIFRPVPLDGEVVEAEGKTAYRIIPDPHVDATHTHPGPTIQGYRLESRIRDKAWRIVQVFNRIPYFQQDIESLNFVIVHSPKKVFNRKLILDLMIDDGYVCIFNNLLSVRVNGELVKKLVLNTEQDRREAYKTYFNIDIPSNYAEHLPKELEAFLANN
ncbi:hypothetical protein DSO57_1006693 [Entomophthora muscae]|uniref:Uncharacterized protein n=1 Tax=Entomophthora muscae TaxID=34485 RepID=A0ACC2UH02_9FUNG|nr:hypothetical protein DSO57_1006693 [Entomophthora muscae]